MTVYLIVFVAFTVFVFYVFLKKYSRAVQPFPKDWHQILVKEVKFYRNLSAHDQLKFQRRMMQFLSETYIDSVAVPVSDLDKILVASSAVIPVFGFKEWHYSTLSGVLIYPDNFNEDFRFSAKDKSRNIAGVVGTGRLEKKMILSRKALYHGFKNDNDGHNTAIHEFVHLIDKMDDLVDGIPEILMQQPNSLPWLNLVHKEMQAILNKNSKLRAYGATNQAEFFAVASEYFFEKPKRLKKEHPELYKVLSKKYRMR